MTYQTTNPATGKVMQEFPGASDVGLEAVLSTAHACHQTDWRHRSVKDRATVMRAAICGGIGVISLPAPQTTCTRPAGNTVHRYSRMRSWEAIKA